MIRKVQIIIITDSKAIDKIGAFNVKSRNLYEKIKLIIDVYHSKSMQWEIRVVSRPSGLDWGRGGVVWITRECEPLMENPVIYVGKKKSIIATEEFIKAKITYLTIYKNIIIIDCNNDFKEKDWATIFQNSPYLLGYGLTGSILPRHTVVAAF
jgi:hypothetical protein